MGKLIILIIVISIIVFIVEYTFKNSILGERKTSERAINILKERGLYDENIEGLLEKGKFEEMECLSEEGYRLKGYYYDFNNKDKGVILVHGYTANHIIHSPFIEVFKNEGFNILLIDMRSHGESEGKYATYGVYEKEDLKLWVNILKNKLNKGAFIGLHGQSMGGATVLMYGGDKKDVDFIVSDCGYSNGRDILKFQIKEKAKVPFYPLYNLLNLKVKRKCKFDFNKISPRDDIKDLDIPIFFAHGKKDITVPFRMSKEMYELRNKEYDRFLEVEDAGHMVCYGKNKEEYIKVLHEFLEKALEYKKKKQG